MYWLNIYRREGAAVKCSNKKNKNNKNFLKKSAPSALPMNNKIIIISTTRASPQSTSFTTWRCGHFLFYMTLGGTLLAPLEPSQSSTGLPIWHMMPGLHGM
ncbi:unnamed protein product [Ixodes hexagonus]